MTPGRSPRSTFFTESNVIVSVTAALRHLICEKAIQFVPFVGCFHGYQVGPHIPTRLTSLIPRTVNVMDSIGGFPWATWTFRSWNIEAFIYQLQLRNRKRTVFLSSYRNTSGSLGEREMLWEHEPHPQLLRVLRRVAYAVGIPYFKLRMGYHILLLTALITVSSNSAWSAKNHCAKSKQNWNPNLLTDAG